MVENIKKSCYARYRYVIFFKFNICKNTALWTNAHFIMVCYGLYQYIYIYIYIFQYVARKRNISHLKAVTNNFIRQSGYAMSRFIDNEVNYT